MFISGLLVGERFHDTAQASRAIEQDQSWIGRYAPRCGMARIGIVGGGAFGTAMACVMRRAGHEVRMWAREPEVVASINDQRTSPRFLAGIELAAGMPITFALDAVLSEAETIDTAIARLLAGLRRA